MSTSFVYVISANAEGPVKIGHSIEPHRRLKQLQTGREDVLQLHYVEEFPLDKVKRMEAIVHKANNHLRMRGEWFRLPVEKAILEVQFALIRYGDEK